MLENENFCINSEIILCVIEKQASLNLWSLSLFLPREHEHWMIMIVIMIIYYHARRAIIINFMICGRLWAPFVERKVNENLWAVSFNIFQTAGPSDTKDLQKLIKTNAF